MAETPKQKPIIRFDYNERENPNVIKTVLEGNTPGPDLDISSIPLLSKAIQDINTINGYKSTASGYITARQSVINEAKRKVEDLEQNSEKVDIKLNSIKSSLGLK